MSELKINNITDRTGGSGPVIAGVSTVSSSAFMVMPSGDTANRSAGSGRAVIGGGNTPSDVNTLDRIEIGTLGNAVDFGDSSVAHRIASAGSSPTRAVKAGGYDPASNTETNLMEFVQIMTTGNTVDFGDLNNASRSGTVCTNGHGGLG